jgi:hypothetical protein
VDLVNFCWNKYKVKQLKKNNDSTTEKTDTVYKKQEKKRDTIEELKQKATKNNEQLIKDAGVKLKNGEIHQKMMDDIKDYWKNKASALPSLSNEAEINQIKDITVVSLVAEIEERRKKKAQELKTKLLDKTKEINEKNFENPLVKETIEDELKKYSVIDFDKILKSDDISLIELENWVGEVEKPLEERIKSIEEVVKKEEEKSLKVVEGDALKIDDQPEIEKKTHGTSKTLKNEPANIDKLRKEAVKIIKQWLIDAEVLCSNREIHQKMVDDIRVFSEEMEADLKNENKEDKLNNIISTELNELIDTIEQKRKEKAIELKNRISERTLEFNRTKWNSSETPLTKIIFNVIRDTIAWRLNKLSRSKVDLEKVGKLDDLSFVELQNQFNDLEKTVNVQITELGDLIVEIQSGCERIIKNEIILPGTTTSEQVPVKFKLEIDKLKKSYPEMAEGDILKDFGDKLYEILLEKKEGNEKRLRGMKMMKRKISKMKR